MSLIIEQTIPHVIKLILNRPEKRNALDAELITQLITAFYQCEKDKARLVIITAAGKHFCAGADLNAMIKIAAAPFQENVNDAMQLANLLRTIYQFPVPVIACTQGSTMGGGLGILACCDIVVAAEDANFCFSETKIGLSPSVISPYIVPLLGNRLARYYFLTAEKFSAKRAKELNLVQKVVANAELTSATDELVKTLLKNSPNALRETKKMIHLVNNNFYSEQLIQSTAEHLATMRKSVDATEGLQAFLNKRLPTWSE